MALSGIIWSPVHSVRTAGTVSDIRSLYPVSEFAADDAWRQNVSIVASARLKDMSFVISMTTFPGKQHSS